MSLLLSIETSTKNCSVSISKDGHLIDVIEEVSHDYSHAEQLVPFIDQILKKSNYSVKDLDAVVVGKGPGSYTGLRIGVSSAKGLCYALNIPLISISTIEAMAYSMRRKYESILLCPMIDARRMEVYCALFGTINTDVEAKIIDEHSFLDILAQQEIVFFGDGAEKCRAVLTHHNAIFESNVYPSASDMIDLAHNKFSNNNFVDVAYFEPYYLKDFVVGKKA